MNEIVDMSRFVEAKSDQLNSDDLIGAPRTITITSVSGCDGDQPIAIHYEGDGGKPFKPCKTIRRVMLAIWGRYASEYVGRSMTIYRDDSVTFGGLNVGGIRISHMSDLDKETVVVVMKSKGKKAGFKVLPLVATKQPAKDEQTDPATKFANAYIAKLATLEAMPALDSFVMERKGKLDELQAKRPELYDKVSAAIADRIVELADAPVDDEVDA
jgi:hypothetical protein